MAVWKLYILWSMKTPRTYTGISEDVDRRCKQHNEGKVYSTKNFIPWKIVYEESAGTHAETLKREKYYKSSAGRRQLKKIIGSLKEKRVI